MGEGCVDRRFATSQPPLPPNMSSPMARVSLNEYFTSILLVVGKRKRREKNNKKWEAAVMVRRKER